jgi:hypothetical protein
MPVRSDGPSGDRSAQSELDRRAVRMVGHLLTTGIWLEHQPKKHSDTLDRLGWEVGLGTFTTAPAPLRRFAVH